MHEPMKSIERFVRLFVSLQHLSLLEFDAKRLQHLSRRLESVVIRGTLVRFL
jgi:hypothetical protein